MDPKHYGRAEDQNGKRVKCPRCRTWLFEVFQRSPPYLFCTTCEWFAFIIEEEECLEDTERSS